MCPNALLLQIWDRSAASIPGLLIGRQLPWLNSPLLKYEKEDCREREVYYRITGPRVSVWSRSVVSDSCDPMDCSPPGSSVHGILQAKNTVVGCHFLLQGIFPTQGLNPGLPHWRQTLYRLSLPEVQNTGLWAKPMCTRSVLVNITWPWMRVQLLYILVNCWHFLNFWF